MEQLRVAFFPDSYLEINGAAMTCRQLTRYADRNRLPFLCIYAGEERSSSAKDRVPLQRSSLAISMEESLAFDPFFLRHYRRVAQKLEDFRPDVIHVTGLNDVSILGLIAAHRLKIPVVASWHTNLHEFAARRLERTLGFLPNRLMKPVVSLVESGILSGTVLYYSIPRLILAPNAELVEMLHSRTGRKARVMGRGVDAEGFSPDKRSVSDDIFRIGFAGRLRPEKNLDMLVELDKRLVAANRSGFEFLIVGDGPERARLSKRMPSARFTGYIEGSSLAEAYSNMDLFVFPSESDTFGNVIQEAFASGVPAIVSEKGGPKFIVDEGKTGFIAKDAEAFFESIIRLMDDRPLLKEMSKNARQFALTTSWEAVFSKVYESYRECIRIADGGVPSTQLTIASIEQ